MHSVSYAIIIKTTWRCLIISLDHSHSTVLTALKIAYQPKHSGRLEKGGRLKGLPPIVKISMSLHWIGYYEHLCNRLMNTISFILYFLHISHEFNLLCTMIFWYVFIPIGLSFKCKYYDNDDNDLRRFFFGLSFLFCGCCVVLFYSKSLRTLNNKLLMGLY